MKKLILITGLLCGLFFGSAGIVWAEPSISKSQAASIASSRYPGKVINVILAGNDSAPVYRVKVLDKNGGMHIVIVDGNNGQVLSAH